MEAVLELHGAERPVGAVPVVGRDVTVERRAEETVFQKKKQNH
jgi:hypothetical protein